MRRIILTIALLLVCLPAHAATITITSDQPIYDVGDTITLSVHGDPEGAIGWGVYGGLVWDPALAETLSVTQQPLGDQWILGGGAALPAVAGRATVWNQIHEQAFSTDESVGGPGAAVTSTIVLRATAPGPLTFAWEEETTYRAVYGLDAQGQYVLVRLVPVSTNPTLDFFGATSSGYSVSILGDSAVAPVPEPSAALIFATSLVVCAIATRRRGA